MESSDAINSQQTSAELSKVNETELSKTDKEVKDDIYSYTKLKDFTSEIFKIEMFNLPNYFGYGQLRKLLNSTLKLNTCKIKAIGNPPKFVFVTFKDEADRETALKVLNGYVWKGKALTAKKANPAADPLVRKRKAGDSEDCIDHKKSKTEEIPVELRLKNVVTPLWNVPYEEQLTMKQNDSHKLLMKLSKSIEKVNRSLLPLLSKNRKENHYQCCPMDPIIPSPVKTAYRNKCEFTAGRHLYTKEKTVGFRLNSYKEGSMSVAEPDDCINISPEMLKAVKSFERYIRESEKDVYNPEDHGGYWRQLTVRTSNNKDVLLIIVMHPQSLTPNEIDEEKEKIKQYYETNVSFGVTSVYFQLFSKKASHEEVVTLIHLMGKKYLEVSLLDMKFRVSPEAFFQINVPATELLYTLIADMVKASPSAAVLDVCCGTGTISLCLAKAGAKVIGIEMCVEAVENARLNAEQNNVSDVDFLCGKAEDVILTAIKQCEGASEIIAVVDPPRAGLHQKVLKVLRATASINKIIYVACNQNAAFNNFVDLSRAPSNNYQGSPFYPVKAAVIDMFPYTPHKEMVLVFQRSDTIEL